MKLGFENGLITILRGLNNRLISLIEFDPRASHAAALDGLALARRVGHRQWMFQFRGMSAHLAYYFGEWDDASAAWHETLAEDPEPADRLLPVFELAKIAAGRGESVATAALEIAELASQVSDPQVTWASIDGPALLASADGRLAEAIAIWRSGMPGFPLKVSRWKWNTARLSIRLGDVVAAKADLTAQDEHGEHTPWAEAERLGGRAGVAALDGQTALATRLYVEAIRAFNDLGVGFVGAQTAIEMASVLDPAMPEVGDAVDAARELLTRLRARPFLDQLDAAVHRHALAAP